MIPIEDVAELYCEALVVHNRNVVFGSFYGRETAIQETLARLSLKSQDEAALTEFSLALSPDEDTCWAIDGARLEKTVLRLPEPNLFGNVLQLWLYAKRQSSVQNAYVLYLNDANEAESVIWQALKRLSPVPLVDLWQDQVLALCREYQWIDELTVLLRSPMYPLAGSAIWLPTTFDDAISALIRTHQLPLPR